MGDNVKIVWMFLDDWPTAWKQKGQHLMEPTKLWCFFPVMSKVFNWSLKSGLVSFRKAYRLLCDSVSHRVTYFIIISAARFRKKMYLFDIWRVSIDLCLLIFVQHWYFRNGNPRMKMKAIEMIKCQWNWMFAKLKVNWLFFSIKLAF